MTRFFWPDILIDVMLEKLFKYWLVISLLTGVFFSGPGLVFAQPASTPSGSSLARANLEELRERIQERKELIRNEIEDRQASVAAQLT